MKNKTILSILTALLMTALFFSCAMEPAAGNNGSPAAGGNNTAPAKLIEDPKLEEYIRIAIPKREGILTKEDLQSVTKLEVYSSNDVDKISTLKGIENLVGLTTLKLNHQNIKDISYLSTLTSLTELDLVGNKITDITPLSSLKSISKLNLSYNDIEELSPLSELTTITSLKLAFNQITNIAPLEKLTNITHLYLNKNMFTDISILEHFRQIKVLNVRNNKIGDIGPLIRNHGINKGDTIEVSGHPNITQSDWSALVYKIKHN